MKKGKLLIASLLVLLTMTGCGGKKLTCSNELEAEGLKMTMTVDASFKGEKVDSMKMTVDYVLSDSLKDQKQALIEEAKKELSDTEDVKVTETKDGFRMVGTAKKSDLGVDDSATYDEVKKVLEQSNLTCK